MYIELILNIPLSTWRQKDFWAQHFEKKGRFSVPSAYHMLVETKKRREDWLDRRPANLGVERTRKQWSSLWKAKVTSKIKVFVWRLTRNSIPTAEVRFNRHKEDNKAFLLRIKG